MKQQPDLFFENQLRNAGKVPPPQVWNQIENRLSSNKDRLFYLRSIAASLILLALCTYAFFDLHSTSEPSQKIAQTHRANDDHHSAASPGVVDQPDRLVRDKIDSKQGSHVLHQPARTVRLRKSPSKQTKPDDAEVAQSEPSVMNMTENTSTLATNEEKMLTPAEVSQPQPAYKGGEHHSEAITIVLTAEETQEYLTVKETPRATSEQKKSSTLKKFLKKAADLSSNQDPFGELRQKKNELLALNFKSEKQRGQKK